MWLYGRMLRISWTLQITNQTLLNIMNRELLTPVMKRKTSYLGLLGHIMKNDKYNLLRLIINWKKNRGPGGVYRRTMSWLHNIRAWTGKNVQQLLKATQKKEEFEKKIKALGVCVYFFTQNWIIEWKVKKKSESVPVWSHYIWIFTAVDHEPWIFYIESFVLVWPLEVWMMYDS